MNIKKLFCKMFGHSYSCPSYICMDNKEVMLTKQCPCCSEIIFKVVNYITKKTLIDWKPLFSDFELKLKGLR